MNLCFAGDLLLGSSFLEQAGDDRDLLLHPLKSIEGMLHDVDLFVVNLEGCLGSQGSRLPGRSVHLWQHPVVLEWLKHLNKAVCVLGNNHILDLGPQALQRTLQLLENASVPFFGAGANANDAGKPLFLNLKGRRIALISRTTNHPSVGSIIATAEKPGCASFEPLERLETEVRELAAHCDTVGVILHWGREYYQFPELWQVEWAARLRAAGARILIGHHPHVIQGIQQDAAGLTAYSLGNLFFPAFRTPRGHLVRKAPECSEILLLKVHLPAQGTPEATPCLGRVGRGFQVEFPQQGGDPGALAKLRELSRPLGRPDYPAFLASYESRRSRELRRHELSESLRRLVSTSPVQLVRSMTLDDIRRFSHRLMRSLKP